MKASQRQIEWIVGLFMFLILGALAYFTIILSYDNIFTKSYELRVMFRDVTGLIRGDKVYVHGVDVGRVKELTIGRDGVLAELTLKYDLELREDYDISVKSASVLGGKYIAIDQGSETLPRIPSDQVLIGRSPVDFITEASDAVVAVRTALEEGGILKNIEVAMANVRSITDDLEQGKGTLGRLLKDEELYENISGVAASLRVITERIERGEGAIGKLMSEDEVYDNVKAITADFAELSGRLVRGEGTLGKLLAEDDTLYQDLSGAIASLRDVMATVAEGEGTLGKLVKDDEVYEQLKNALIEVRAMIDDLRETSPFTTFGTLFFGAF
ncbi:MAG TPA: MlaD family protein [Kiritimatiellia bacterium]|nr:MlaD family protein [Kiritimatiellia bacterium]